MKRALSRDVRSRSVKPKTVRLVVRTSPELLELTKHASESAGVPWSTWCRKVLEQSSQRQLQRELG